MDLTLRLNILKDAGQITEDIYNKILEVIKYYKESVNIELTEENGAMFITHLCAALTRVSKDEIVNKMDDMIFSEIKNDVNYEKTSKIADELENIYGKIPNEEREFIEMHICTLLNM